MSSALLALACFLFLAQDPATTIPENIAASTPGEVQMEARNNLKPVLNSLNLTEVEDSKNPDLEHSDAFRKAAEQAWRATHNGSAPFEAGFSIDENGRPGNIQLSIFAAVNAKTHLSIASSSTALGTLHVHTKYGESTPSLVDINAAKTFRKMVYVESRTGLYAIDPAGKVRHVFDDVYWFSKKG